MDKLEDGKVLSFESASDPIMVFNAGEAKDRKVFTLFASGSEMLVEIYADGHVVFGPTYDKEVAARQLWECLGRYMVPKG